jgi:imidazolonepropionase-like amidohydrolase
MAVATDLNPGSSPMGDLWACSTLACLIMGLTVEEALLGITRIAGLALGRSDLGVLRVGGPADLVLMSPPAGEPIHEDVLVQRLDGHRAAVVLREGRVVRDPGGRVTSGA